MAFIRCLTALFVDAAFLIRHTLNAEATDFRIGWIAKIAAGTAAHRAMIKHLTYSISAALTVRAWILAFAL